MMFLTAFQTLAAYYLEKTAVDVFAVTGSNGKTMTKDMLAQLAINNLQNLQNTRQLQ